MRILNQLHQLLLSDKTKARSEKFTIYISIVSFLIHLIIIELVRIGVLQLDEPGPLLSNPISAVYTPFSFILIYEVYLLIYYLPKSTTAYIAKQYEIIALIIIRRLFKDLSTIELSSDWFKIQDDLQFTYDLLATLIIFFLLYLFYRYNKRMMDKHYDELKPSIRRFVDVKRGISILLVPIFLGMAGYSFGRYLFQSVSFLKGFVVSVKNINNIFFDQFFTILILVDVLVLLISFLHTDKFNRLFRNSGFVVSTVLIKLSFSVEGLINTLLIVVAVLFGVLILVIGNQYDKIKGYTAEM